MGRLFALNGTVDDIPAGVFALRSLWVAMRLVLVYYLGQQGVVFFYQAF